MIFRKPYAFFIKNFKLFHFILFVLSSILLYRTSIVYNFIKEYIKTSPNVIGKELTDTLFASYSYILIVFMIIINLILIIIMIRKIKPFVFYIINISLYISILVIFVLSHRVVGNLEIMLVEPKTLLAIRDILNIARLLQTISVLFYLVRATGFDIKKFDFGRDLQELNISEEDSEEYEVAIEFEGNEILRSLKRFKRNFKYYYKENQLIINIIVLLSISLTSLVIYINISKYDKVYKEQEYMNVGSFQLGVEASYNIKNDYKETAISTNEYDVIAVKLKVKSNYNNQISTARTVLVVDGYQYYHIRGYKNRLFDLGKVYDNDTISTEFEEYLFVYQIPKNHSDDMIFEYVDNIEEKRGETQVNTIDIKLNPVNIDNLEKQSSEYTLENQIDTSDSNISDYNITINNYDIQEKYTKTYYSCVNVNECYTFNETINPTVTTNKEKTLLRIEGLLTYENKLEGVANVYEFIKKFGTLEYTVNGITHKERNDFNQVKFAKVKENDTYYIEVDKEVMNADTIKLIFNIRNFEYTYILRGNA